jgi:hypothetical protein
MAKTDGKVYDEVEVDLHYASFSTWRKKFEEFELTHIVLKEYLISKASLLELF